MPEDVLELEQPVEELEPEVSEAEQPIEQSETEQDGEKPAPVTSLFQADGKRLDPTVKGALDKIKGENESLGKLLSRAVFRTAELDREFPGGLTEARELRDKVEELGGVSGIEESLQELQGLSELDAMFTRADPVFVDEMIKAGPENFAALAPVVFDRYAANHPEAFQTYLGRVVFGDMQAAGLPLQLMRLGDVIADNPRAVEALKPILDYLGEFKALAGKPMPKFTPKAPEGKEQDLSKREESLRQREWSTERDSLHRGIYDTEMSKVLAGRKPDEEERAQIRELFLSRSKSLGDRAFPGWKEKALGFVKRNDKAGYLRYVATVYRRVVPEALASAVNSTLKGKKPASNGGIVNRQQNGNGARPQGGAPPQSRSGFRLVAKAPGTWEINYGPTDSAMLKSNRAVLNNGDKVTWR